MKRARHEIPDYPPDRPRSDQVRRLIEEYYRLPGNSVGGKCHVVLDDNNTDNDSVEFCLGQCEEAGDHLGARIMGMMLLMTGTQRRKAIGTADTRSRPDPHDDLKRLRDRFVLDSIGPPGLIVIGRPMSRACFEYMAREADMAGYGDVNGYVASLFGVPPGNVSITIQEDGDR